MSNTKIKNVIAFENGKNSLSPRKASFPVYTLKGYLVVDQNILNRHLSGFWKKDVWRMSENPTGLFPANKDSYQHIKFDCANERINLELKYVISEKFVSGAWSPKTNNYARQIHRFTKFINATNPKVSSLLDFSMEEWIIRYTTFLKNNNLWFTKKVRKINANQKKITRISEDKGIEFTRAICKALEKIYDSRDEFDKDIWDGDKISLNNNSARSERWLSFKPIKIPWLRDAAKRQMRNYAPTHSLHTCHAKLVALTKFSLFIAEKHPKMKPEQICRKLLLNYIAWLSQTDLSQNQQYSYASSLRIFLEICAREEILPIPEKPLLFEDDMPWRKKYIPRFIPQFVMKQVTDALEKTAESSFKRMYLVLIETGRRISELCRLELNCLIQDAQGDYFIKYFQSKLQKEHTIPVSKKIADIIIEQRKTILAGNLNTQYLFPNKKGAPYKAGLFRIKINEFAVVNDIRDETEKIWRFQPHQFRHTAATQMVNNGVPLHIIQQYLGHESAEMTIRYAHIMDQTLKEEFAKYLDVRSDLVDIGGNLIQRKPLTEVDNADLQWIKRTIQAQVLPNGYCGLPAVQTACPHANACLSCASFRTDASFLPQHKQQLKKTKNLVQISRDNGWTRQAEMNERVQVNLETIISALEPQSEEEKAETSK